MADKSPFEPAKEVDKKEVKKRRFLQPKPVPETAKTPAQPLSTAPAPGPVPIHPPEAKTKTQQDHVPALVPPATSRPMLSAPKPDVKTEARKESKKEVKAVLEPPPARQTRLTAMKSIEEDKQYLENRKKTAATRFQKTWRGFICRKQHREQVQKLKQFAMKRVPHTNVLEEIKSSKPAKSIIKSHTEENVLGEKGRKRVRFQEGSPAAKTLTGTSGKKSRKEEKKRSTISRPLSEDEIQMDIRQRLSKVLTKVDEFVQKEEKGQNRSQRTTFQKQAPPSQRQKQTSLSPPRARLSPQRQLEKADFLRFFQRTVIPDLVSQAVVFGESLLMSREIQHKFEQRPINKDVFALIHEFQYDVTNPLPHSLHCVGSLGRVMYMESQGNLRQIDITAEKQLSPYFLGIRMPLRYTPIIDTICDTKSCRIYTLNALWKLEVWSLEQLSSLPIKRVPMVNCEVTKDFVETAYKSRFQFAKPTFLSMSDCANQILIVNTSCVDGNIVFVDPISLSILRRIHLLFSEYEVPGHIKDAIDRLVETVKTALKPTSKQETVTRVLQRMSPKTTSQFTYKEFVDRLSELLPGIDPVAMTDICRDVDLENKGYLVLDEVLPYIDEEASSAGKENKGAAGTIVWADWLISESKVFQAKQVLAKLIEAVMRQGISPQGAFATFANEGGNCIGVKEFERVLNKLCPDLKKDEIDLLTRIADAEMDQQIQYEEFCKLVDRKVLQSDAGLEEAERILREPLAHKNDLPTLIRKCFENGINLKELFKREDKFKQGLIERDRLYEILENLSIGYSPQDVYEIFRDSAIFDAHGNADYTIILQHGVYTILEKLRLQREMQSQRGSAQNSVHSTKKSFVSSFIDKTVSDAAAYQNKTVDSRKVVIEDLIYLHDFDIVIYTTTFPKSSNIYVTHTVPLHVHSGAPHPPSLFARKPGGDEHAVEEMTEEVMNYKFLATLKGHKNSSPPTIYYVEETGCLLSGEKEDNELAPKSFYAATSEQKLYEPNMHPHKRVDNLDEERRYEDYAQRTQRLEAKGGRMCEILMWSLQKDLVHMMQANPPWVIRPSRRFEAHAASIVDIVYLSSAQLIATASTDQTIKLFDPTASPYPLTEPRQFPIVATKPGAYVPLPQESTTTNACFREVKRINTAPSTCFKLQTLNFVTTAPAAGVKEAGKTAKSSSSGSIEWLVALRLMPAHALGNKKETQGAISGHGIERVRLSVPAIRHDDAVPENIYQECENDVQDRRKKAMIAFQSVMPYNLEHLQANMALQNTQTNRLSDLFKQSMLNRATGKYMTTKPLREVFQILLEIPERKKYGHIIKEKGRNLVLSVSEVYFYLKKYFQIHPTNLSQVMFAKLVKAFNEDQNKSLIGGIRKWSSEPMDQLASYIRKYGLSKDLLEYAEESNEFLTRTQFAGFLGSLSLKLQKSAIEGIVNEIDAMGTDRITYGQLQQLFGEEIKHYNITMFRRPNPLIEEIRGKMLPAKKMRLHEALGSVDEYGDGYITKAQFKSAFLRSGVAVEDETLAYFFDMTSEKFMPREKEKVLSIQNFFKKVLTETESKEFREISDIFDKFSASLAYRGIDCEAIFADAAFYKLDYTAPIEKSLELMRKDEFASRLDTLHISQLSDSELRKITNYLSLNDRKDDQPTIYLSNYLRHMKNLPSASKSEPAQPSYLVAVICGKLLGEEARFVKQCQEVAEMVGDRIESTDLRSALLANGVQAKYADMFVEHITSGGQGMELAEILKKMKEEATKKYNSRHLPVLEGAESELNFQEILRESLSVANSKPQELIAKCRNFDKLGNGRIRIFHMLNVFKHNVDGIEEIVLAGLQYELTILHPDEYIDYKEFLTQYVVAEVEAPKSPVIDAKKEKVRKLFNIIMQTIAQAVVERKLNLQKALQIFDSNGDGKIGKEELGRVIEWLDVKLEKGDLNCLFAVAPKDMETGNELVCLELQELITNSGSLCPYYNRNQWQLAGRRVTISDQGKAVADNISQIEFLVRKEVPKGSILARDFLVNVLRDANLGYTEDDLGKIADYAVMGSRNPSPSEVLPPPPQELLNFSFFAQSLSSLQTGFPAEFRVESPVPGGFERRVSMVSSPAGMRAMNKKKESEIVGKVVGHFQKVGLSFYDFFENELAFDPATTTIETLTVKRSQITDAVKVLQIPLSLQEQRLLVQAEASETDIRLQAFCERFETPESAEKRRRAALEKAISVILIRDLPWDLAFDSFDKSGAGKLSKREALEMLKYWKLGLTVFEMEDLIKGMISQEGRASAAITREMFNEKLVSNISVSKDYVLIKIRQTLLFDLHEKLLTEQSRNGANLRGLFEQSDYKKNGAVNVDVLPQILASIHIRGLSKKELELLLESGAADPQGTTLNYAPFCTAIELAIQQEILRRDQIYAKLVQELFATMRTKKLSVFDTYSQFDVLQRDGISKIELVGCLQGIGVKVSAEEANVLWSTVINGSGCEGKLNYQGFLWMFAKTGQLKLSGPEVGVTGIREKFAASLAECKTDVKLLYERLDKTLQRSVGKAEFIGTCKGTGMPMSEEELSRVFEISKIDDIKGLTFQSLSGFVQSGVKDEQELVKIFGRIHRATIRRKIDWDKAFKMEKRETNKKASVSDRRMIGMGELASCIRKLQLGIGLEDIEAAIGRLTFRNNGLITCDEFLRQVQGWAQKRFATKKVDVSSKLKAYISKVNDALKRKEIGVEQFFAEMDQDKDGALTLAEHHNLLLKLGVDLPKTGSTEVFVAMAGSAEERLKLDTLKKYLNVGVNSEASAAPKPEEEEPEDEREIEFDKEEEDRETLFYKIREKLAEKETNIHTMILKLKVDPLSQINVQGIRKLFEGIELLLTLGELGILDGEIKRAFGKAEYSYQDLRDFMVRKRIDLSELYAGLGDPGIVICLQSLVKALKKNGVSYVKAFNLLSRNRGAYITRADFVQGVEGMQLGLSLGDVVAFFEYMDKLKANKVTKTEFLQAMAYSSQTSAPLPDPDEAKLAAGNLNLQNAKVGRALKQLGDVFEKAEYSLRQISCMFDIHGTGVITKAELASLLRLRNIEISLGDVRVLNSYLANIGDGKIYTSDLMGKLQEVLNQNTDGLYSVMQAKPIVKKIVKEIEGELNSLSDEILKYDRIVELEEAKGDMAAMAELSSKSGIEKHNFYKLLGRFGVFLTEDEKSILNSAFGFTSLQNLLDTHKLMNMLESLPEAKTSKRQQYTLEWERRIYRKLGNYLRTRGMTVLDCFPKSEVSASGYISQKQFTAAMQELNVVLDDKEIATLLAVSRADREGNLLIKDFAKKFYQAYLLDAEAETAASMTKEDEIALVSKVIKKMKEKEYTAERAFSELDKKQVGFVTVTGLQSGLPEIFDIHLSRDQILIILRYMDINDDGMVPLKEFTRFYQDLEKELMEQAKGAKECRLSVGKDVTLEDVFDGLLTTLKDKGLTLLDIFEQLDVKRNGYITLEEFVGLVQTIGFMITEQKAKELLSTSNHSFEGKVSYKLLHRHTRAAADRKGIAQFEDWAEEDIFKWRDRAIEGVIKGLNATKKPYKAYFAEFDANNDGILTPKEFREAMKALRIQGTSINRNQIDRLLVLFAVDNKTQQTSVSTERINEFLQQYSTSPFYTLNPPGAEEILVNEDMFVLIVQHFDGYSVLLNKASELFEKSQYIATHRTEFCTRGCSLLANSGMIQRLKEGARILTLNLKDALVSLSSFGLRLIKNAAQSALIDPATSALLTKRNEVTPDEIVKKYPVPDIDPHIIRIDKRFKAVKRNGYTCYRGSLIDSDTPVRILVYNSDVLNRQSSDGKVYWRHLELELAAQIMMHANDSSSTFKIIGKYEKRRGIGEYSVDVCVVLEDTSPNEFISLEDLLSSQGGLLQMPLLRSTETALYIAKLWARDMLGMLGFLHGQGFVMRTLGPAHLYLNKATSRISLGSFAGIGRLDSEGKVCMCPDIGLDSQDIKTVPPVATRNKLYYDNPYMPPEHLFRHFTEHTSDMDTWSFGALLYTILIGTPPTSYYRMYKAWRLTHEEKQKSEDSPLVEPSSRSFVYDPLSSILIDRKEQRIRVSQPEDSTLASADKDLLSRKELEEGKAKCDNTIQALQVLSYSSLIEDKGWLSPYQRLGQTVNPTAKSKLTATRGREAAAQLIETLSTGSILSDQSKPGSVRHKSILGLMLDLIACCMDVNTQDRPRLSALLASPMFASDGYERANVKRFAESVFLYKDPYLCVNTQVTVPLRRMCLAALKDPDSIVADLEQPILGIIATVMDHINSLSTPHLKQLSETVDAAEQTAPHVPLARELMHDRVLDMIIFLCHRYTKTWLDVRAHWLDVRSTSAGQQSKTAGGISRASSVNRGEERPAKGLVLGSKKKAEGLDELLNNEEDSTGSPQRSRRVKFADDSRLPGAAEKENFAQADPAAESRRRILAMKFKTDNKVLGATCRLLYSLVQEMQYKESVLAPHVGKVLDAVVKLLIGEDGVCASEVSNMQQEADKHFFALRTFLRGKHELRADFVPDKLDKLWFRAHQNVHIANYETFWNYASYIVVLPLYQDAIGVTGIGGPKYPVICEYIRACNSTAEVYSMFGKKANKMYGELLPSSRRTSEYYAELLRLCQNMAILTEPTYGRAAKASALGDICAMLYGGGYGRIRATLDLRVTKYLHCFLQHSDEEIRKRCALIFCQLARSLANDEAIALLSSEPGTKPGSGNSSAKRSLPDVNKDWSLSGYIYNQNAAHDPIDTKRYIAFAYDLPAVHFQQNKQYLGELAWALQSPVFSAAIMRQIKCATETMPNKLVLIKTLTYLFASDPEMTHSLDSALSDCYLTLARLMVSMGGKDKKKQESALSAELHQLFSDLFELRSSKILDALKHATGVRGLLKQAGLRTPKLKNLADLAGIADRLLDKEGFTDADIEMIPTYCKDMQAYLMNLGTVKGSQHSEAVKKGYQRSVEMLAKAANVLWQVAENPKRKSKAQAIEGMKVIFLLWDWLANKGLHEILFEAMDGRMIDWILSKLTLILSEFRKTGEENPVDCLTESLYNKRKIQKAEVVHRYERLQLMPLSIPLQHIIAQLLKLNDERINAGLEKVDFGRVFGEHLQLQYEFLKLTMDAETERLGLLDVYVEQNFNRLCTVEYLLQSRSAALKNQFLKSRFVEKLATEYIKDTREFSVKFNKIDLKFLAYRHSYPIRNEAISIMAEILKNKDTCYELYTELIQRLYRHQVIGHECGIVKSHATAPELQVQTSLVFFSMLLQAEEDVLRGLKDEGVADAMAEILHQKPILQRQFPLLAKYFRLR